MGVAAEKSWNPQLCGGVGLRVGLHSYSTVKSWNPHYYNGGGGGGWRGGSNYSIDNATAVC